MRAEEIGKLHELVSNVYAFYRQDFSEFAGRVWTEAMKPYDFKAVADAMNRHLMNPDSGQFMPKPADIVKMLQGSTQDSALVAWTTLDRKVRHVGPYASVTFDDPILANVVRDMGGWVHLCNKTDDEWPFVRNEFVNRYRGYKVRGDVPALTPRLIGIAEHNNVIEGYAQPRGEYLEDSSSAAQKVIEHIQKLGKANG
jgi:hypothetical protein